MNFLKSLSLSINLKLLKRKVYQECKVEMMDVRSGSGDGEEEYVVPLQPGLQGASSGEIV